MHEHVNLDKEGYEMGEDFLVEFEDDDMARIEVKRGEIYYVEATREKEPFILDHSKNRPAIIVSNDRFNTKSGIVSVIYLSSTAPEFPVTNVPGIMARGRTSTAVCLQVFTINKSRLRNCIGTVPEEQMHRIDAAICYGLGIEYNVNSVNYKLKAGNQKLLSRLREAEAKLEEVAKARQEINYPEYVEQLKLQLSAIYAEKEAYNSVYHDLVKLLV